MLKQAGMIQSGLSKEDADDATGKIREKWYSYLTTRYPESLKHMSEKKSYRGHHPEESYVKGTKKNLFLDKPSTHGGWPKGEYDPPVMKQISGWLEKMEMLESEHDSEEEEE